jgi:tRNA nucleotidyltransferase (CCA-adding enzyme)
MTWKRYLVGGAVRDELLGVEFSEHDWVVTGSTPEELIADGFRQVGGSFPVFLHPDTHDEHALARTERKQGHGHRGFSVDFHPGVTLEEDLARRDLTINAMARDENGVLFDPYNGEADLRDRILRHVTDAFAEDPLRVLRVARFAARFALLGFTVHPSTMELMREIVDSGELEFLAAERCWGEIHKALITDRPSEFFLVLRRCGALKVLLAEVDVLFGVPQPEKYHPEIDTGDHTMMSIDVAADENWSPEVLFAVLVHDLGKGLTDPAEWPSHRDHESSGLSLVEKVCGRLRVPGDYRDLALKVCRNHLRAHRIGQMRPGRIMALIEGADLLRRPDSLKAFSRACEADYRGRKGWTARPYPQGGILADALTAALSVKAADLNLAGLTGLEIGEKLRQARIAAIASGVRPTD